MLMVINTMHFNRQLNSADSIYCTSCVMGKQSRLPFPATVHRAQNTAELIHSDVWGLVNTASSSGDYYFVVFTDYYARYLVVYLIKAKLEVFDHFKHFVPWIETQSGKCVKRLHSNNGGEYVVRDFLHYFTKYGIEHETTMPYTPQQNDIAECSHQTVVTCALNMHHLSGFPRSFWGWAILNSAHIKNMLPLSSLTGRTPFEAFYGQLPDLSYIHPFGCLAYVHVPDDTCHKYNYVSWHCFLLSHVRNAGYILWDPSSKCTIRSCHVQFDEHVFYGDPAPSPLTPLLNPIPGTLLSVGASLPLWTGEPLVSTPAPAMASQVSVGGEHHDPPVAPVTTNPALPLDHPPADPPHIDPPRHSTHTCQPAQAGYNAPTGVETQVSMGTYRPYHKTKYWTC
jgi:hypothetical protein